MTMITLSVSSCENAEKFKDKECIGKINDPFGMGTYEILLFKDSSFYLPSEGSILHWAEGSYSINGDTLRFKIARGESHLSQKKYIISEDTTTQNYYILTSIERPKNIMFLKWNNRD